MLVCSDVILCYVFLLRSMCMRKYILFFMMLLSVQMVVAQVMTDQQIIQFAKDEAKAGTSQSQIVTKLMQRGVKIDQIRRLRNQYGGQTQQQSGSSVTMPTGESRLRKPIVSNEVQ